MQTLDDLAGSEQLQHSISDPSAEEVLRQLERIVNSIHFRSSRRYPALLRYIVEETLAGHGPALKERTLGIEVFGRPYDYDTNMDPVVRVTAGKIRQRLTQYYDEPGHEHELRFRLHLGSYMPHFERAPLDATEPPLQDTEDADAIPTPIAAHADAIHADAETEALIAESMSVLDLQPVEALPQERVQHRRAVSDMSGSSWRLHRRWKYAAIAAVALVLLAVPAMLWLHQRSRPAPENAFWTPLLLPEQPLLFVLGVHSLDEYGNDAPAQLPAPMTGETQQSALASMTRSEMVAMGDAISFSNLASLVTRRHHDFRTLPASGTSMERLRQGPVVLIGAFNNAWTLRLTSNLRYHFVAVSDSVHLIQDRQNPSTAWGMDTGESSLRTQRDYAIVARFHDTEIDQPVLVAGGIGKSGTEAAAEFLTGKDYLRNWLAQTKQPLAGNIEFVIETEMINGQHGAPHVIASHTW